MNISKLITLLVSVFFVFLLWIIYLANTGQNSIFFNFVASIPYGDKVGHFCIFGTLTLGTNFAFKLKSFRFAQYEIYLGSAVVLLFALIEELSQYFIPSRTFDFSDLIADMLGIVIFSILTLWLSKTKVLN